MSEVKGKPQRGNTRGLVKQTGSEALLVGTIADLLEEIKNLWFDIRRTEKSKEETSRLFQSLLSRYRPSIGANYRDVINLFIYDSCGNCHRI